MKADASDFESSSCPETFKPFDNYMPITKRQLHKEAVASYTDLKRILEKLKEVQDVVKEDLALNKKFIETTVESANAAVTAQNVYLAKWAESSTSMAWSVGPRMTRIENTQAHIQSNIASIKTDTSEIKTMMTEMFCAFKGDNLTHTATEVTPSYTEGEKDDMVTEEAVKKEPTKEPKVENVEKELKLVKASSKVRLDLDAPLRVPYEIHGKMYQLTEEEIQAHLDKEENIEQAAKEVMLSKPELIKVFHEEAAKVVVDPKILASEKGGQEFRKIQDAKIKVLNKEHFEKNKKAMELKKKRIANYRWATSSRLKHETITDIHIHLKTKPVIVIVFRGNDQRNFNVFNPLKFDDFGVTELDKLGPIIQNKKNKVVGDLMTSLGKRYERLKKIPTKLRITPTLPDLGQVLSLTSGRKRKIQELEPETRILGLECNRSLPEGIPFVKNLVIEQSENGKFFIDVFGYEAFQRTSDIHKVNIETLLTNLVMALNISTPANQRFYLALRRLIESHLDQEKSKSKKVKLESVRYKLD
ncbi:hypothetical protein Tco_0474231 [Tanacetum coccineum]